MNAVRRAISQLLVSVSLALGLWTMAAPVPASAQLNDGMTTLVAPFTIEVNGRVVGQVVVVGGANTDPPPGYTAGTEYWTWTGGRAWREGFTLVPRPTVPRHGAFSWQTFPHERFDLSRTVSFPAVSPGVDDAFYEVQIAAGTGWVDQGYMWLDTGSPSGADLVRDRADQGSCRRRWSDQVPHRRTARRRQRRRVLAGATRPRWDAVMTARWPAPAVPPRAAPHVRPFGGLDPGTGPMITRPRRRATRTVASLLAVVTAATAVSAQPAGRRHRGPRRDRDDVSVGRLALR